MMKKRIRFLLASAVLSAACLTSFDPFPSGLLSFSAAAQEADSIIQNRKGSITVIRTDTEQTGLKDVGLTLYKVMDINVDTTSGNTGYMAISLNEAFAGSAASGIQADHLQNYSASALEALASQLERYAHENNLTGTNMTTDSNGRAVFGSLDPGWYLIRESSTPSGNLPIAPFFISIPTTQAGADEDSWVYDVTARPKAPSIPLEKLITNGKGVYDNTQSYEGKADTVAQGDTVDYSITTVIPNYSAAYFEGDRTPRFVISDILSDGLTLDPASVHVYFRSESGQDVEITDENAFEKQAQAVSSAAAADLTITFKRDFLMNDANKGKGIKVSYSAAVNDKAVKGTDGNPNKVTLAYDNSPYCEEAEKLEDETKVYTFGVKLYKFDADSDSAGALKGARFELYKESGKNASAEASMTGSPYKTLTTGEDGYLDFERLDSGVYFLIETKAPDGYSLLTNPVKLEIIPNTSGESDPKKVQDGSFRFLVNGTEMSEGAVTEKSTSVKVTDKGLALLVVGNHKGFTLPATGGSGVGRIAGFALCCMGILVLVLFHRKKDDEADGKNICRDIGPTKSGEGSSL